MDIVAAPTGPAPSWRRWTIACGVGETIGMAAAATAAGVAFTVVGEPQDLLGAAVVLSLATLGGLVEGLAVGLLQFSVLTSWLTSLSRRRWVGATVAVAVTGWFVGMLPSTLISLNVAPDPADTAVADGPSAWVMPIAGIAVGVVAGAIFGAAQAWALKGQVSRPRVWIGANTLGWAAAMAVIFTGASLAGTGWPLVGLLALGAATGVLAGLSVGAITGWFLPSLNRSARIADRSHERRSGSGQLDLVPPRESEHH